MKHNIIIIGTGGHSSVVLDAIESSNSYEIIGFIDCCKPIGEPFFNYKVLGSLAEIHTLSSKYNSPYFFIAVGEPNTREKIHDKITEIHPTIKYATIIHNNATVSNKTVIEEGSVIMAGSIISANSRIGRHCVINHICNLDHDSILEDYVSLSPGVVVGGNCTIGNGAFIGISSTIRERIKLGKNCVIGAGSLVLKNIPENIIAFGSPARVIKKRTYGEHIFK